jgi:hypothetical protein
VSPFEKLFAQPKQNPKKRLLMKTRKPNHGGRINILDKKEDKSRIQTVGKKKQRGERKKDRMREGKRKREMLRKPTPTLDKLSAIDKFEGLSCF